MFMWSFNWAPPLLSQILSRWSLSIPLPLIAYLFYWQSQFYNTRNIQLIMSDLIIFKQMSILRNMIKNFDIDFCLFPSDNTFRSIRAFNFQGLSNFLFNTWNQGPPEARDIWNITSDNIDDQVSTQMFSKSISLKKRTIQIG